MTTVSDDLLTQRATQGDRQAFEAIYERYHRDLYRFCLAMLGNPQDAQDALQNTMVKVLRALPGEERQIQLKPWLYRIARNEAVETVRRRRDSVEIEPEHTVTTHEVADTVEARERLRRLFADLEQLPERQRSALVMRELADLGFEQIGEAFETSAAVARQTVYEARLSLRQMEAGREMSCDQVMRELSDADGRVTRRRELQAHLRGCASCRAFADSIEARRGELAAIAPLPVALSAAMLHGILSGKASAATLAGSAAGTGSGGGGVAGTIGAGAGKAVATSAILKSVAAVAVVAVGVGAASRGGLIHVPLIGGSHEAVQQGSAQPGTSGGSAAGEAGTQLQEKAAAGAAKRGRGAKGAAARHRAGAGKAVGAQAAGARRHAGRGNGAGSAHAAAPAQGRSHSHGGSHAGGRSSAPPASSHGNGAVEAHKPPVHHPLPSPAGGGASHRHRAPPKHPPVKPRPPEPKSPVTPPAQREASGSAAASSARE